MAIRTLEERASDFKASLDVIWDEAGASLGERSFGLLSKSGVILRRALVPAASRPSTASPLGIELFPRSVLRLRSGV
jgi:hypothetical protein